MNINYIPDVMSEYDCHVISRNSVIKQLNSTYDFIECGEEVVCCKLDTFKPCDEVYVY